MAFSALTALQGLRTAGMSYVRVSGITGISPSSVRRYILGEVAIPLSRQAAIQSVARTINYNILRSYGVQPADAKRLRSRSITNVLSTVNDLRNAYTRLGNAWGIDADTVQDSMSESDMGVEEVFQYANQVGSDEFIPRIIKRK